MAPRKDLTLKDMISKIPAGGLMNPKLRQIGTDVKKIKPMKSPTCGRFHNVLGK